MVIEFGAPETVLSKNITDYLGVFKSYENKFYVPPIDQRGLAKLRNVNAHHASALIFKRNMIMKFFQPNDAITLSTFKKIATDGMIFGHYYPRIFTNALGGFTSIGHLPAVNMRRLVENTERFCLLKSHNKTYDFGQGEVIQLKEYDVEQSLYGMPEYYAALQALLLNEAATLFRRRYFNNGNHAGYIFYTSDPNLSEKDENKLKESIKNSKGVGNFRSIYLNIPNGNPDAVKLIPVGDISTKDEFERIKNISRNDIIAAHRLHPALGAIMPENTGGFGDIEKISRVYYENEVIPMQQFFLEINEVLGRNIIQFREPDRLAA